MWAYVNGGAVQQIFTDPKDWTDISGNTHPAQLFIVGSPAQLAAVGLYPATYADSAPNRFSSPSKPVGVFANNAVTITRTWTEPALAVAQAAASALVDQARIAACQGGTTIAGMAVLTDPFSLIQLIGAYINAQANPAFTVSWPATSTTSTTLTAAEIIAIFAGVTTFLGAQTTTEQTRQAAVAAAVSVAAIETLLQGWGL